MTDWLERFLEGRCARCGGPGPLTLALVDRMDGQAAVPFVAVKLGPTGVVTDPRAVSEIVAEVPERYAVEPRCDQCRART